MNIREGYITFKTYKTYYRIVNPEGKKTPLLICHGGPGSTHNSFETIDRLAFDDDRPIVMYDQLGCGQSSLDTPHPELWRKETWVEELENLRAKLNLSEIHLLGHSWGGMLSIIYLCDYHPSGIKSVVLSSTLSSVTLWRQETHRLLRYFTPEEQKWISDAENTNSFDTPQFKQVYDKYFTRHIGGPFVKGKDPDCLTREKKAGTESYLCAWGPSEFSPSGTLKDYEYTKKLSTITSPVLLCSGVDDESTPYQNKVMFDALQCKKQWQLFAESRHMSYVEENEKYIQTLRQFLNENENNIDHGKETK